MQVLKRKKTSRCTDAKIVYEYILSEPVEKKFISILQDCGITETKQLGDLILFSFQEGDWLSLKGISGDQVLYVTHLKSDTERAEKYIDYLINQLCSL